MSETTWRMTQEQVARLNTVATHESRPRQTVENALVSISEIIRAVDTWEAARERGVPKLHAMEMVLLQDRERR